MQTPQFRLIFADSQGRERYIDVAEKVRLGRAMDADVVLDEEGVSRLHCEVSQQADGLHVRDLGSTNGTFVNGSRIKVARLSEGDTLVVGRLLMRVEVSVLEDEFSKTTYIGSESVELTIDAGTDSYPPQSLPPESAARHLHALYGILRTIAESDTSAEMLSGVLETILATLPLDFGYVLVGADQDHLQPAASLNRSDKSPPAYSQTVVRRVLKDSQAVLANDIQAEPDLAASESIAAAGTVRIACAPVPLSRKVGVLYVASRDLGSRVEPEDLSFLCAAAHQIGLAAQALSERENLARENELLRKNVPQPRLIGASETMQRLREMISRAAVSEATVLITGESGTGKELVARGIHEQSARAGRPFVAVNCGALPASIVQSELFGHERGAFTGADKKRMGLVKLADTGTLFLDEVGELPPEVQVALLRLLEEKRFFPLGSQGEETADVRFLAATNRNLDESADRGEFRTDLLYRLKVIEIRTPPLREHPEDLDEVADFLLHEIEKATGRSGRTLSDDGRTALRAHRWPGNVRELRNVLERALLLSPGTSLTASDLGLASAPGRVPALSTELVSMQDVEREHILRVLDATGWNKTRSAEILGVARITLYDKIKNYQLKPST